jgi:hypothetical protein
LEAFCSGRCAGRKERSKQAMCGTSDILCVNFEKASESFFVFVQKKALQIDFGASV